MLQKLLRILFNKLQRSNKIRDLIEVIKKILEESDFLAVSEQIIGFHGDQYLLNLVNFLLLKSDIFIETGTRRGDSLKYVADSYKNLKLFSCEPNKEFYEIAKTKLEGYNKCTIYNELSQNFLPKILETYDLNENLSFFFLDAHGKGFDWPLREEVDLITHNLKKAIILIDDFKVPNNPQFEYDVYNNQECKMSYIKDRLNSERFYELIYPKYKIKTSNYPHLAGYIVILMGLSYEEANIPLQLFENFNLIKLEKGDLK